MATRSICSMSRLNWLFRVSMPLLRNDRSSRTSFSNREARRSYLLAGRFVLGRAGLEQLARNVPRLGQQEQADLRHVRAGGDVD